MPPKRPDYGTRGRPIALKANFFKVSLPRGDIHHYDVAMVPGSCPRKLNRDVVQAMVQEYSNIFKTEKPVFDGRKNLYSRQPLPIGNDKVSDRLNNGA